MSGLPEVGRWIKYNWRRDETRVEQCKVVEYEDSESFGWSYREGTYSELERQAVLEYPGGDIDSHDKSFFGMINWSYIQQPREEELATLCQEEEQ